ncbi:hypothetical protein [Roseimaritima ulvae]|uniref:DUF4350 domain-containing protein n=1 Tax=Roseimaritima ulvae TaxID=980254 RepID=A0A5B9QRV9_9BACT|nr:hypothetical protein [Roseimaritima ulvae]QEG40692.1 hypothetical protein UC8_27090 [Roseimaritima ulvae]
MSSSKHWTWAAMLVGTLLLGCSRSGSLDTSFGVSHGRSGHNSINGFGSLREGYHAAGWESRTIGRLGDRMLRLDAMVWTPTEPVRIYSQETEWFEDWLSGGGKTLIYVLNDSGSEADYWRNAARLAPPAQRMEYRRRAARADFRRSEFLRTKSISPGNGWFQIEPLDYPQPLGIPQGRWAPRASQARSADTPPPPIEGLPYGDLQVLYQIQEFDSDKAPAPAAQPTVFGPGVSVQLNDDEAAYSETPVRLQNMLSSEQSLPVVTRITSSSWKKSQIIVVAGGSLLSNYGMTTEPGRHLGANLIAATGPAGEIGFLISDSAGVRISNAFTEENRATGMELLTVWPLSLVTIHLALVGLVVCLILAPIFGRPRNEQQPSQSDFADHIDAIATLMKRMDSDDYARHRISEYMRRVRGETTGPWVLEGAVNAPSQQRPAAVVPTAALPPSTGLPPTEPPPLATEPPPTPPSQTAQAPPQTPPDTAPRSNIE